MGGTSPAKGNTEVFRSEPLSRPHAPPKPRAPTATATDWAPRGEVAARLAGPAELLIHVNESRLRADLRFGPRLVWEGIMELSAGAIVVALMIAVPLCTFLGSFLWRISYPKTPRYRFHLND